MTFDEARTASLLGLKVRITRWDKESWITNIQPEDHHKYVWRARSNVNTTYFLSKVHMSREWEIYKEETKP